jgi:hypothetical protein
LIATVGRIAPRDSIQGAANAGRVRGRIDEKASRLPIAAIAKNVINALR